MADPKDIYRFAWALWIKSTPAVFAATTDLTEAAELAALVSATTAGAVFTRRILSTDIALTESTADPFYGIVEAGELAIALDNSDGTFTFASEWRTVPAVLFHVDRETATVTEQAALVITNVRLVGSRALVTIGSFDTAVMETLLPAAVIDPAPGSPFETSASPAVPVPVVFGEDVPVRAPSLAHDPASDPPGEDFAVGFGGLYIRKVYLDEDRDTPELEALGAWATAPGSPAYVSTTRFSVSDDQSARYAAGMPIRFKTTASGGTHLYSDVVQYDTGTSPHQVQIAHALLDSGLNSVAIGGDWLAVRGYTGITDGLLPVPGGSGAMLSAVRVFATGGGGPIVVCDNPSFPVAATHVSAVVLEVIMNATWGLSTHSTQSVNATAFAAAQVALNLAGLVGAVRGALAYDQQQRRARDVLNELLMMRGMRLRKNSADEWLISVDTLPLAASKTFRLGPGEANAIKIRKLIDHGKKPLGEAVRRVILHWMPLGRAQAANQKFTPREYARISIAPCAAVGRDLHIFNQWIRDEGTAEKVVYYVAETLKGADEFVEFTAGQEARDVTLGEAFTVQVPSDGISADYRAYATTKTLSEVRIRAYRVNNAAFDAPTGVVHSNAGDERERRTAAGVGVNLLPNPDFSPPLYNVSGTTEWLPHGWAAASILFGMTVEPDFSAAVVPSTVGGHYLRITTIADRAPDTTLFSCLVTNGQFQVPPASTILPSIYCDQSAGLYAWVKWYDAAGSFISSKLITLVHDPTDTNGAGWGRMYGRARSPSNAALAEFAWGFSKTGTYQVDATMLESGGVTARKPSNWSRAKPQPITQLASVEITFNGASTYTATNLIPAGVRVIGVTSRVTQAITLGTATSYKIGTAAFDNAWGDAIANVALDAQTTAANFVTANEILFPTATSVVVAANGTITSGKLRLVVEYSRPGGASRA